MDTQSARVYRCSIYLLCCFTAMGRFQIPLCMNSKDSNKKQLYSTHMSHSKDLSSIPRHLKKKQEEQFSTKNNWSPSTSAQTPSLAADSGSTLIQTVRQKKIWRLGPQPASRARQIDLKRTPVAVSRLQNIAPICMRDWVKKGEGEAEGDSEMTWWREVNVAPKNNNKRIFEFYVPGDS